MSASELTIRDNSGFMQVGTLSDAIRCSELIAKSSFCPQGLANKPGDVLVALQMGQELGLKPMQALQNIAVINGRPSLWGDAMLAVCRQAPDFEYIEERFDEATMTATCKVKRMQEPEVVQTFSKKDAESARLWAKAGPWTSYPKRMLQMRARGFALRDAFPDTLRGIIIKEEADDYPKRTDYSQSDSHTIDVAPQVVHVLGKGHIEALKEKMEQTGTTDESICGFLKVNSLEEMSEEQFDKVMKGLDKKIEKLKEVKDEPTVE
jgi:hypothetical protein